MNERSRSDDAFDEVMDLESVPPSTCASSDIHIARTAVAPLPSEILEELRAKRNAVDASNDARTWSFANEAPTAPGKDAAARLRRPIAPTVDDLPPPTSAQDLVAAVSAVLTTAELDAPADVAMSPRANAAETPSRPVVSPIRDDASTVVLESIPPPPRLPTPAPPLVMSDPRPVPIEWLIALVIVGIAGILVGAACERLLHHH